MEAGAGPAWPALRRFNKNQVALPRANSDQARGRQRRAHRDNGDGV